MTELEKQLASMQSFEAIRYVLNDIELHDLQCIDIMKMLASKRSIWMLSLLLHMTLENWIIFTITFSLFL